MSSSQGNRSLDAQSRSRGSRRLLLRNYWTAEYLADLGDPALAVVAEQSALTPRGASQMLVAPWGGAVGRLADSTPLGGREAKWVVHPFGLWDDPGDDEAVMRCARTRPAAST